MYNIHLFSDVYAIPDYKIEHFFGSTNKYETTSCNFKITRKIDETAGHLHHQRFYTSIDQSICATHIVHMVPLRTPQGFVKFICICGELK